MMFDDKLATLTARAVADAQHDPVRMADIIERLAATLGLTIAIAARGDGSKIDLIMDRAAGCAREEAARKSPLWRAVAATGGDRDD